MRRGKHMVIGLLAACGSNGSEGSNESDGRTEALRALIDQVVASDPSMPGVILRVETDEGFSFAGAAGAFELDGAALRASDLFRAASITKTFTAAATLVLAEQDKLDLEENIDALLTDASVGALQKGGYDPGAITVRQLLGHTAGIYDYTEAAAYYDTIRNDPLHRWTRGEQLQVAMDEGAPLNEPGEAFNYGDTHYILAGEIIEQVTGMGLGEALRTLLRYDEFGLENTWLETLEDPPSAAAVQQITHPYIGDEDTREWDASWDLFGGGGLVTSTADLLRLLRGARLFLNHSRDLSRGRLSLRRNREPVRPPRP